MAEQIEVITDMLKVAETMAELKNSVEVAAGLGKSIEVPPVLVDIDGGLLHFVGAAFAGLGAVSLHAEKYDREPEGRGAHFDVYDDYLSVNYPWLAVYNLAGTSAVRATVLEHELELNYNRLFPEPNDAAYAARRNYAAIAFANPEAKIYQATLTPGMGMILMQHAGVQSIVHEVVPKNSAKPGSFMKLVNSRFDEQRVPIIESHGMKPLDEVLTQALIAAEQPVHTSAPATNAAARSGVLTSRPPRRSCNLD
jgi:hypothetical protein